MLLERVHRVPAVLLHDGDRGLLAEVHVDQVADLDVQLGDGVFGSEDVLQVTSQEHALTSTASQGVGRV